ncbi:hypothetical protein RGQ15_11690 [Paracoccus sp. MBLB3053]|uniref:Cthe-2314-like HEPN domain-containing protein n=1 Tax=Paracoccus aurantius TaxID=3073814 RepID=A0ABU2HVC1_9RHOB|nr:hypothetical protein [Paracoccus sp. MBLB3053]MDS9468229.1 hypothetical protein [Paracoccus sp. MBLB3053]
MIKISHQIEHVHSCSETEVANIVNCWVRFNHCKHELPFSASSADPEPHGRKLYERIRSGEFGEIHPYGSFASDFCRVTSPREIYLTPETFGFLRQGIEEANLENSRGTPRGIVLVWSALLEIALGEVIRFKLPGVNMAKTLGGKINQLHKKGALSDADDYNDLVAIRDIRNHAAHNLRFSHFEHLSEDKDAFRAYRQLYAGYAEEMYYEVADLLFIARNVFSVSCLGAIERAWRLRTG